MASLSSLPPEILIEIFDYVPYQDHRWSLVTASRRFYTVLLEPFYQRLALGVALTDKLVLQLLKQPQRAAGVRHVQASLSKGLLYFADIAIGRLVGGFNDVYNLRQRVVPAPTKKQLDTIIGQLPNGEFAKVQRMLCKSFTADSVDTRMQSWGPHEAIWAGLLLLLTPNIRSLDLAWRSGQDYCPRYVLASAAWDDNRPIFNNLTNIWIQPNDQPGEVLDADQVQVVFRLPALESLTGHLIYEKPKEFSMEQVPWVYAARQSNVTHLSFTESNGAAYGMHTLIRNCPKLQSFQYCQAFERSDGNTLTIDSFRKSLLTVRWTLRSLRIDYSVSTLPSYREREEVDIPFGSFKPFTELRHLHMRLCNLLGKDEAAESLKMQLVDILPSKLESLYISFCNKWSIPALTANIQKLLRTSVCTPNLRQIDLEFDSLNASPDLASFEHGVTRPYSPPVRLFAPKTYEQLQPLVDACEASGVNLHILVRDGIITI